MNNNTLNINIYEEINIIDVFCYIKEIIKEVIEIIYNNVIVNYVISILFGGVNNYSNPPNSLIGTKLDVSQGFSFIFVLNN